MLTVIKTIPQAAIQFAAYDGVKDILISFFPRDAADGMSQVNLQFSSPVSAMKSSYVHFGNLLQAY